ncbi:hypothetical protein ID866_8900 [Astraeus odoratus]|nr:hypothetical protein ID866_8900 [Astraeus odoratus]
MILSFETRIFVPCLVDLPPYIKELCEVQEKRLR